MHMPSAPSVSVVTALGAGRIVAQTGARPLDNHSHYAALSCGSAAWEGDGLDAVETDIGANLAR